MANQNDGWSSLGENMTDVPLTSGDGTNGQAAPEAEAAAQLPATALPAEVVTFIAPAAQVAPVQGAPIYRGRGRPPAGAVKPPAQPPSGWHKFNFFKSQLDRLIEAATMMRLLKRGTEGQLHFIRNVPVTDLARFNDIESFLAAYYVQKYGYGEYNVQLVKPDNSVSPMSPVFIANPDTFAESVPNPVDRATDKLDQVLQQLTQKLTPTPQAIDPMTMFMLQNMMSEVRQLKQQAAQPPPMPMMPPLPPPEPVIDVAKLMSSVADMVKATIPPREPPKESWSIKDLIMLAPTIKDLLGSLTNPTKEALEGVYEVLDQMRQQQQSRPSLKDHLEDFKALAEVAQSGPFRRNEPDSFAGVLSEVFRDFPGKINALGGLIDRIQSKERAQAPEQRQLQAPQPVAQAPDPNKPPPFDQKFIDRLAEVPRAPDEAHRIGYTLIAFQELASHVYWQRRFEQMKQLAVAGDPESRASLIKGFRGFLEGLAEAPVTKAVFSKEEAEKTAACFEKHADEVLETLKAL